MAGLYWGHGGVMVVKVRVHHLKVLGAVLYGLIVKGMKPRERDCCERVSGCGEPLERAALAERPLGRLGALEPRQRERIACRLGVDPQDHLRAVGGGGGGGGVGVRRHARGEPVPRGARQA